VATKNSYNPDFAKLSESFGIKAMTCSNEKTLEKKVKQWLNTKDNIFMDF